MSGILQNEDGGTREMKGMDLERTFFIEKIELRKDGLREKVILVGTLPSIISHLDVS
jgi:hypothetical protein